MLITKLVLSENSKELTQIHSGGQYYDGIEVGFEGEFTLELDRTVDVDDTEGLLDDSVEVDVIAEIMDDVQLTQEVQACLQRALVRSLPKARAERAQQGQVIVYKVVHVNGGCYESVVSDLRQSYKLNKVTECQYMAAFDTIKNARSFQQAHGDCVVLRCEATIQPGQPQWYREMARRPGTVFCSSVKPIQLMG
jgi:hypothetical protein